MAHIGLCIGLSVTVILVAAFLIICVVTVYMMRIRKLYHRRLVPKGQSHTYRHDQEPISYGFEYKPPHGANEGPDHGVGGTGPPDQPVSRVARKSSTLEFPGLPTPIVMEDHE